jgi:hypothetical protein
MAVDAVSGEICQALLDILNLMRRKRGGFTIFKLGGAIF